MEGDKGNLRPKSLTYPGMRSSPYPYQLSPRPRKPGPRQISSLSLAHVESQALPEFVASQFLACLLVYTILFPTLIAFLALSTSKLGQSHSVKPRGSHWL